MITKLQISSLLIVLLLLSCKENPTDNALKFPDTTNSNFALILCEGLWGYNNSTVSKLNLRTYEVQNDFTSLVNKNFKIGDTGNDIAMKGDTFFVVVTTSKALEYFEVSTGKLIGYLVFDDNSAPRHIAVINDSIVAITDLYKDCVYLVNISAKIIERSIKVGPAPEFVEYYNGILFVTNSGYGDYRAKEPKAGTLSVVDLTLGREVANIAVGPNPIEVAIDSNRKRLYVSYNHLPSLKDSIGGILILDLNNWQALQHWKLPSPRSLKIDSETGDLYFLSNDKVFRLIVDKGLAEELIVNPRANEIWYSLGLDTKNKLLLIGNAKNYTVEGEVLVFKWDSQNSFLKTNVPVGLNPSEIVIKN